MADLAEGLEDNPLDAGFEKASKFLQHSTDLFKQDQLLQFYGLYKQATVGPCNVPKPAIYSMAARAKWYAWDKVKHLDPTTAKQEYVRLMDQLAPDWNASSTGEAGWVSVSRPKRPSETGPEETNKSLIDRIKEDDLDGVREAIRHGDSAATVNVLDHEGLAAIHWAADRGNVDVLACLLTVDGIDVDLRAADGQTALHYASSCGNVECLQLLLTHGADRTIRDGEGETCSDVAYNQAIKACLA